MNKKFLCAGNAFTRQFSEVRDAGIFFMIVHTGKNGALFREQISSNTAADAEQIAIKAKYLTTHVAGMSERGSGDTHK